MNKNKGFTLVELLIVVAIMGVLAAIAIPSYTSYVERKSRVMGQQALTELGQAIERYYARNYTYVGATAATIYTGTLSTASWDYVFTLTDLTETTYTLTATSIDTQCITLTLNQAGVRGSTGAWTTDQCWR